MAVRQALGSMQRYLRRGPPVATGGFVLTPVVIEQRGAGTTAQGYWIVASKRPIAVIVAGAEGRRLLRLAEAEEARR